MFADVVDKPTSGRTFVPAGDQVRLAGGAQDQPVASKVKRGLRLNMANNPKKVKDPTEVALSAIQEALNISDVPVDTSRGSMRGDPAAADQPSAPVYDEGSFD